MENPIFATFSANEAPPSYNDACYFQSQGNEANHVSTTENDDGVNTPDIGTHRLEIIILQDLRSIIFTPIEAGSNNGEAVVQLRDENGRVLMSSILTAKASVDGSHVLERTVTFWDMEGKVLFTCKDIAKRVTVTGDGIDGILNGYGVEFPLILVAHNSLGQEIFGAYRISDYFCRMLAHDGTAFANVSNTQKGEPFKLEFSISMDLSIKILLIAAAYFSNIGLFTSVNHQDEVASREKQNSFPFIICFIMGFMVMALVPIIIVFLT